MGSAAETTFKGLKAVASKRRKLIALNDQSAVENFADLRCILSLRFTRTSADACFACSKKLAKKHSARLIKVQITSFCFELDFKLYTFNVFMPVLLSIKEPHKVVLKLEILTWKLIFPAFSGELPILFKKRNQLKASEKVKCAKPPEGQCGNYCCAGR